MKKKSVGFASGIGFILAAAGSAVGLGNLWAFPYKTSANGGAAFVLMYIICVLFIGVVAMISEIFIGRRAQANPITAYKKANKNMGFFGLILIAVPFIITCYYGVLGGYTLRFAISSFSSVDASMVGSDLIAFSTNRIIPVVCTFIFISISAFIILGGVKDGIEKSSKILMPSLFVILIFLVIYCLNLGDGVVEGLKYYLYPDFSQISFRSVLVAMGQAFFSLSLGMGAMMVYGSYTGKEINILKSTAMICIFDTLVALLAGLTIFPAVFAMDLQDSRLSGIVLMFVTLPAVFSKMGFMGKIIGFLFFFMVAIAAITSVISLLEVVTQFFIQKFKISRKKAAMIPAMLCLVISIPIAYSLGDFGIAEVGGLNAFGFDFLTFLDEITNAVLMPVAAFVACITVGWVIGAKKATEEIEADGTTKLGWFKPIFQIMVCYITPLFILIVEIMGIYTSVKANPNYWWIVGFAYGLIALCAIVYFAFLKNKNTGTNADEID